MDGLVGEGRQVRDWFPENFPGCFRLSKNEALNDLDMMHANIARNEIRARQEIEKPLKRARLIEKLQHELATHTLVRSEHYTIRAGLDQARADIAGYRDAIAQSKRNLLFAQREHDALAHTYVSIREEFAVALDVNSRLREQVEVFTRDMRSKLEEGNKDRVDAEQQLNDLRNDYRRQLELEAEVLSLRERLQASLNQQTLFEALLTKYREAATAAGQNTSEIESSVIGPPLLELDMAAAEAEGVADEARQQLELQAQLAQNKTAQSEAKDTKESHQTKDEVSVETRPSTVEDTMEISQKAGVTESMQAAEDHVKTETSVKGLTQSTSSQSLPATEIMSESTSSSTSTSSSSSSSGTASVDKKSASVESAEIQPEKVTLDPLVLLIRLRAAQETNLQLQAKCRELDVQLMTAHNEAEMRDQRIALLSNALAKTTQDLEHARNELLRVRNSLRDEQLINKSLREDLEVAARSRRRLLDELGSEEAKYRAVVDCLGTADARAADAEDSLREVIHEIRVLRNAVTSLQDAYDRVLNERHIAVRQLNDMTAKYHTLQGMCKRLHTQTQAAEGAAGAVTAPVAPPPGQPAGAIPPAGTGWLEAALDASAVGAPGPLIEEASTTDILQLKARLARYAALNRTLQAELRAQEEVKRAAQKEVRRLQKQLSAAQGGKFGDQIDLLERIEPRARDVALRRGALALIQQARHQKQLQTQLEQEQHDSTAQAEAAATSPQLAAREPNMGEAMEVDTSSRHQIDSKTEDQQPHSAGMDENNDTM